MEHPTERQRQVLKTIKRLTASMGYPPTIRELGAALGISNNGVMDHLRSLKRKGKVDWQQAKSRTLQVIE